MKATNIVKASGWLIIWNNTQGAKKGINSKRRLFFFSFFFLQNNERFLFKKVLENTNVQREKAYIQ